MHFRDNKIRSCSFIKETENSLKAVPFYDKRNNTLYPTPSTVSKSWNAQTHGNQSAVYAGMGSLKPLHAVYLSLLSTTLKTQEIQWELPISDHLTPIHLTLRLVLVVIEMSNTMKRTIAIAISLKNVKFPQATQPFKPSEINGFVQD